MPTNNQSTTPRGNTSCEQVQASGLRSVSCAARIHEVRLLMGACLETESDPMKSVIRPPICYC